MKRVLFTILVAAVVAVAQPKRDSVFQFPANPDGGFTKTLNVSVPADVRVRSDSGNVTVRAGAGDRIEVTAKIYIARNHRGERDIAQRVKDLEARPPVEQTGNSVRIGYLNDKQERHLSIHYQVTVPVRTRLEVATDSGSQDISGVEGPVRATADSGRVTATDIASELRATTDSGSINADRVKGSLIAVADSGSVRASGIGGSLDISTDSGSIVAEQIVAGGIRISADSGSVTLRLPAKAGYDVSLSSDSGSVNVAMPMTVRGTMSRQRIEGRIGDGGHRLDVRTDSGSIRVQ